MKKLFSILLLCSIVVLCCIGAQRNKHYHFRYQYKAANNSTATEHMANRLPLVNAGRDTIITLHPATAIRGQKAIATDPDGTIVSYAWSKISGPGMQSLFGTATDSLIIVNLQEGVYKFRLLVTDNNGDQKADTIQITGHVPTHYVLNATNGYQVINNMVTVSGTTPASPLGLLPGDTIQLNPSGVYAAVSFQHLSGTKTDSIFAQGNGSRSTSPSFQPTAWLDLSYVRFSYLKDSSWFGMHQSSYGVHDVVFDHYIVANGDSAKDVAHYTTAPWWQWDNQYSHVSMKFNGTKKTTFYNVVYKNCRWSGFKNAGPLTMGSSWNDSANSARSICLNFKILNDTIVNVVNTYSGSGAGGTRIILINAVGWGWEVAGLYVKDFNEGSSSYMHSHSVVFEFKGQVNFHNNKIENAFAALYRITPLTWTGLPGYTRASYQWNNISVNQLAYSQGEVTQNQKGNLNAAYGINEAPDTCVHNTVYKTRGQPDKERYYAFVVDWVNQHEGFVGYNVMIEPEIDFTYDSVSRHGYDAAIVSAAPIKLVKLGNYSVAAWNVNVTDDSTHFVPSLTSPLLNTGGRFWFRNYDYYGNPLVGKPDRGAVERQGGF